MDDKSTDLPTREPSLAERLDEIEKGIAQLEQDREAWFRRKPIDRDLIERFADRAKRRRHWPTWGAVKGQA